MNNWTDKLFGPLGWDLVEKIQQVIPCEDAAAQGKAKATLLHRNII